MMRKPVVLMALFAAVLAGPLLAASPAQAQSVRSVLQEFGLLSGRWAADCTKPRSTNNWYGTYSVKPSGEGQLVYDSGKDGANTYIIKSARALSKTDLVMTQEYVREKRALEIVIHVEGNRYRTLSSKRPDGTFQVRDGKFNDKSDVPWLNRCK